MTSLMKRWADDDMKGVRIINDGHNEGESFDLRPLDADGNPIDWDEIDADAPTADDDRVALTVKAGG